MVAVGDTVALKEGRLPWYSGYGGLPHCLIPAGAEGTVTHVDMPPVWTVKNRTPKPFHNATFEQDGRTWTVSFRDEEVVVCR